MKPYKQHKKDRMRFTHQKYTLTIIAISICMLAGFAHGMERDSKVQKRVLKQVLQQMHYDEPDAPATLDVDDNNNVDWNVVYITTQEEQELQDQLKKRKWCNAAYAVATVSMLGIDLANLYYEEKEELRADNKLLYSSNALLTLYRAYATTHSLYDLFYVQKSFNSAHTDQDKKLSSLIWRNAHGFARCVIGTATLTCALANGINHYPRMLAVWGLNTAYDAISTLHWQKNMDLCKKIMQQNKKLL